VERLLAEQEPEIIGLSIMTFQRKTAKGIIDLVRMRRPRARKGKHDDQVDSTAQFLDWFKKPFPNQEYYEWLRQKAEALKQQRRGPRPDQKPKVRSGLPAGGGSLERTRLKKAEFPASREFTGNFIDSRLRSGSTAAKKGATPDAYEAIPYASEQGFFCGLAGNLNW
jgi:hypothetical protein